MNGSLVQLAVLLCGVVMLNAGTVGVVLEPRWNGRALALNELTLTNASGQTVSVTRLDLLLSDFAFRQTNGLWFEQTNQQAFISFTEGRTRFELMNVNVPRGSFDRIRFCVGVPEHLNHGDLAQWPPGHALNPSVNRMHWSWQGGYVFVALEGNWRDDSGAVNGYSFHLATDRNLVTIELPARLNFESDQVIRLAMDVDRLFTHKLSEATAATHSREDDPIADEMRGNVERAFSVTGASTQRVRQSHRPLQMLVPSNATPYGFAISSFFPRPELPLDNPLTEAGVELGRRLFHDPLLSINRQQSCTSCHDAQAAFTDPGRAFSAGAEGRAGRRNSMPLFNLAWKDSFFWDGRAASLREQVVMPIQDPNEMHETLTNVVEKLVAADAYKEMFEDAFGPGGINSERLAKALEQFLLTQVSHDSKFDRYMRGEAGLSAEEQRGFELFHTEYDPRRDQVGADCFHCHGGPLFQSQAFANNGLDTEFRDIGREVVTAKASDRGKFAVPSLRNVALTAPYMHDGRFATLEEVIGHYSTGVKRSATLDPNLAKHPSGGVPLSEEDKQALVAFLKTLTDPQYVNIPSL